MNENKPIDEKYIDKSFSDEQAKDFLVQASHNSNLPFQISESTSVKRYCEGGQSLPLNVNDEWVVRMPRKKETLDEMKEESKITQTCGKYVHKTNISRVSICEYNGYSFAVHKSINGKTMDVEERTNNIYYNQLSEKQKSLLAKDLAMFFCELHQVQTSEKEIIPSKPIEYFKEEDANKNQIALSKYNINLDNYPSKEEDLVCCHNDLHGRNIAIDETKEHVLQGIFDFGMCGFNKRSADFVKLYTIDRELARRTMEEYNKISPHKVDIKSADRQFLGWCASNIIMAEADNRLSEQDKNKIIARTEVYINNFKSDEKKEQLQEQSLQQTNLYEKIAVLRKMTSSHSETQQEELSQQTNPHNKIDILRGLSVPAQEPKKQNVSKRIDDLVAAKARVNIIQNQ